MAQASNTSSGLFSVIVSIGALIGLIHIQRSYNQQQAAIAASRVTETFSGYKNIIGAQANNGEIEFVQAEWKPISNRVPDSDAWLLDPNTVHYQISGYRTISAEVAFFEMSGSPARLIEEVRKAHQENPRKVSPEQVETALKPYIEGYKQTGILSLPAQVCANNQNTR